MELDWLDKAIIRELDTDARTSYRTIAKRVRRGSDTVLYRCRRLKERGILRGSFSAINPGRLGLSVFKSYLQIGAPPKRLERELKRIAAHPNTCLLAEMFGSWNVTHSIIARDAAEYQRLFFDTFGDFAQFIIDRRVFVLTHQETFPRFRGNKRVPRTSVISEQRDTSRLGMLEYKILHKLLEDVRISNADLAKHVGKSVSIVTRRVEQLMEEGVLSGFLPLWHFDLSREIESKLLVQVRGWHPSQMEKVLRWLEQQEEVLTIIQQIGPWELEVDVAVSNLEALQAFTQKFVTHFSETIESVSHATYRAIRTRRFPLGALVDAGARGESGKMD